MSQCIYAAHLNNVQQGYKIIPVKEKQMKPMNPKERGYTVLTLGFSLSMSVRNKKWTQ